jgi:hypothetical protein
MTESLDALRQEAVRIERKIKERLMAPQDQQDQKDRLDCVLRMLSEKERLAIGAWNA